MNEYIMKTNYGNQTFLMFQDIKINVGDLTQREEKCFFEIFNDGNRKKEMDIFRKISADKNILLDIGCSYGATSIAFTYNKPNSISYALDGSDKSIKSLIQTVKLNPLLNIKPNKILVGNTDDGLPCIFDKHQSLIGGNQIYSSIKIDTFCKNIKIIPDMIVIDVEGYEYNVLLGGMEIIKNYHPVIYIEIHPRFLKEFHNQDISDISSFLIENKYKAYDLELNIVTDYHKYLKEEETDSNKTFWM